MNMVTLSIDGRITEVPAGTSILDAARGAGIYIPALCHHPDLPPAAGAAAAAFVFQGGWRIENAQPAEAGMGCGICVVEIEGRAELAQSCATPVATAMTVVTASARIRAVRQEKLMPILARHRHACLTCGQQDGCDRIRCTAGVPENERCCAKFGDCELRQVANHVGISAATPRWPPGEVAVITDHPLFVQDFSLCIGCTRCVRACRDLRGIEALGFVFDPAGMAQVGTLAETLEASGCKFCTACVEVCPTGALMDKGVAAGTREDDLVPCRAACSARIDVPGYIRLVAAGRQDEAHAVIREKVPFPAVLGRVCTRPCEDACRRGRLDDPIAICALKRFAAEADGGSWPRKNFKDAIGGKKVAVVGAGPAGMTAAFYLQRRGHAVTVFEARDEAGGMLRFGIPAYRLPRDVLDREIRAILETGIEFRPGMALGKDFTLEGLFADGFDAVFLGIGAQLSRRIPIAGCNLPDVLWGVDFLGRVAAGEKVAIKDQVLVIGGGSVAVDAALTARRCGAGSVTLACFETEEQMPAGAGELAGAVAEGVKILPSRGPAAVVSENGRITGVDLVECTGVFDAAGNFCPQFGGRRECIATDQIIFAVGQTAHLACLGAAGPIRIAQGLIAVDALTGATGASGIYAGGDVARASGTVIHAIAAGRRAAAAIDRALGGGGEIDEILFERGAPSPQLGRDEGFATWPREAVPELDPAERVRGFGEIARGFTPDQARREARRCLQCDLRLILRSNPRPPSEVLPFDEEHIRQVPETEGVFRLRDAERQVLTIKGTADLRRELLETLSGGSKAVWFDFEEERMFTRRESELLQKHLQQHGSMPGGGEDLDDLY